MTAALTVDDDHLGTPEADWLAAPALARLPAVDWGRPAPVVVVAPHPDDEVLAVGGSMADLAAAGHRVSVVAVTDGEASHPGSIALPPGELVHRRRAEVDRALGLLGLVDVPVARLGLPDGRVADHEEELTARLAAELTAAGARLCLAPWSQDGHPDHDAAGRAAAAACAAAGVRRLAYPVWAWHRLDPGELPWAAARRVELGPDLLARKASAIAALATQVEPLGPRPEDAPVLPAAVLVRFLRPFEVVLA